jgi:2,4-dienoyl-CoA reductase-like NADH-dependent reductase (Old Yellow Enzyme family)/thioredoxin reductase
MRLLEGFRVGNKTLRNRVVVTPYTFWFSAYKRNEDFKQYLAHLERQAAGGAAMISLQAIWVPPVSGQHAFPYDYLEERLHRVAEMAHAHGALAIVQSVHIGANLGSGLDPTLPWDGQSLWGFSAVPSDVSLESAHEMSSEEVEAVIEGWGRVAELVQRSGLDGMELHGGHGYLLHQSICPWMNRRQDRWGKPLEFWKAVLARVREGLGQDLILGARVPIDDFRAPADGGLGRERLRELACEIADTGFTDYLNPSEGSSAWHYPRSVGSYRRPHGDFLEGQSALRKALAGKVPVLGVGRITTPALAEQALEQGHCDFVGMTRAHISDPDLVRKLAAGESARIRPCVGANQCINRIMTGAHVTCFHNPETGREDRWAPPERVASPRRILVVGAGPAGLKTAEIAARRGHSVTLVERKGQVGGRLACISKQDRARELKASIDWIAGELESLGVQLNLNTDVDAAFLEQHPTDVVVLATGSSPAPLGVANDGTVPVHAPEDLPALCDAPPAKLLVVDIAGNDESAVVTEQLAQAGHAVCVATPLPTVGAFLGWTHLADHVPRLLELGCEILERTAVTAIADGQVSTQSLLGGATRTRAFDGLVLLQTRIANTAVEAPLRARKLEVHLVGDAQAPRDAAAAFVHGETLGRDL